MPRIYRKVILGHKTNFFKCSDCMDKDNLPPVSWDDTVLPGEGNPGVWVETPLEQCDYCYQKDVEAQEEMHNRCNEMDQQSWEEDQQDPQELK